jgi:3-hydroxyisobutyrate dehydrogenase
MAEVGWIDLGRMGEAMVRRLLRAGHAVSVWNRAASKADALRDAGARVVVEKRELAACSAVFTMVSTTDDLKEVQANLDSG